MHYLKKMQIEIQKPLAWLTLYLHELFLIGETRGIQLSGIIDLVEGYELRPVAGSNVFLILKQRRPNDEDKCCNSQVSKLRLVA